ncbi:MAG: chloride channel protein [Desulfobacterales bacterium C00003060]|nr:MAG: chloride channel protein [Desulfobacterales bacterium S3730MH5]OEU81845.1 MAG: chloride channel protein [Desulfobacterales bacterium C00003060]
MKQKAISSEKKRRPNWSMLKIRNSGFARAGKWMSYYVLIGVIAGLGAIAFQYLCQVGSHIFMDQMAGYRPPAPAGEPHLFQPTDTPFNRWILFFLPAIGGIISGWLVYTFAPEAEGHGTDAAIDAYHNKGGFIRGRIPFIKTIASAITITTGGSGGREGPIAQIGAGFGSFLATKLKLTDRERRIMLAAGIGAGVGSIFRAPLAGALFAAEVLYRDPEFESDVIIPAGISSVVAYCLFCLVFGYGSLFDSQDFVFQNPLELGPYIVLSFVLVGGGILYIKSFYGVQHIARNVKIPNHIKPAIGGLCTGAIGFFLPETLSFGYGFAQMALDNELPTLLLLSLAIGKIFTTSFSIGSGGSGGVFGPSIVIGGALGGAVGRIFHDIMPGIVTQPGAFVVVGMAGFFAAVSNTPISTIIFVSEMTNSYHLLLPSLLVCSLAFLLSRKWTIYVKQVQTSMDSNAHRGDFFVDVLGTIRVKELMPQVRKVKLVPENMPFSAFRKMFSSTDQHYFPVVNKEKKLTGIFSINDIRGILFDPGIGDLVVMKDISNPDIIVTTPSEDLNEVLKKFTVRNLHRLPVVKEEDHTILIGMLDRKEVIQHYNQRVQEIKSSRHRVEVESDREISQLKNIPVRGAMRREIEMIRSDMPLRQLTEFVYHSKFNSFPVVDAIGQLIGVLSLSDCRKTFDVYSQEMLTASDIATHDLVTVTEDDSLFLALTRIIQGDFSFLPVVNKDNPKQLMGVISRRDIMSSYDNIVIRKVLTEKSAV